MKSKFKKTVLILAIILVSILCLSQVSSVKADSGWDSSYDSGSSFDSGSSYDSGSSFDSDGSSSSGKFGVGSAIFMELFITIHYTAFFFLPMSEKIGNGDAKKKKKALINMFVIRAVILIVFNFVFPMIALIDFFFLFLLVFVATPLLGKGSSSTVKKYEEMSKESVDKIIPNFDIEEFNFRAYQIFYDVQIGWMEFDYDKLKPLLSDELYNTYQMDLEALNIKGQKNIMKDFELIKCNLVDLKEENNKYIAKVILEVKFIDYIEDVNTNKVLRGSDSYKLDNTYILTLVKTKDTKENICPSCGAQVDGNATGICEYCKSKLVNETYDWVLSKKEKISQK